MVEVNHAQGQSKQVWDKLNEIYCSFPEMGYVTFLKVTFS